MPLATPDPRRRLFVQGAMLGTLRLVAAFNVILLVAICLFLLVQGLPALSWEFLSTPPREMMTAGGILPCIVGTAILALGSLLLAFPLGVATAVYLHEYAGNTPFARMVRLGVNNLAGVPSVVFGLFGLSFFVTFCGMGVSILSGILTLAVLTLPVIISTAGESLRSVPDTYRQASLALGAGKAQTITRVVLPCAMPGMLTGAILGVARAAGETAAIMFTAAVFYTPKNPDSIFSSVMALPYHMYVLATAGTDIEKTRPLQYGTGLVLILLVLGMNPFITTQGFAKTSMLTTVIGAVINIILDPILIFGLGLGVRGAAIATVLSQAVGAVWILHFLTGKKTILRLRKDYMRPEKKVILPVMALGISTFVMMSTESLLSISFSSSLARYGGDVAVGAMTVITSASQLCTLPIQGICQGGQPVMSFNFGAGKKSRVKEAFRFQLLLCSCYTCLFWLLMMLVPGAVAGIFTSDTALIDYTTWSMRIYMAGIFAMGFQIACQQSFMALGQAKVSLLLACLRKIILLIPLIFILPHLLPDPVFGVFLAEPVSDILAATITTITFFARFDKILDRGAAKV